MSLEQMTAFFDSTKQSVISQLLPITGLSTGTTNIINKSLQLNNLLKDITAGGLQLTGPLKDLLFKAAFAPEQQAPRIRGLTEAYKEAITDLGQDKVDEEALKVLKELLQSQIDNNELAKKTVEAIEKIEPGGVR